MITSPDIAATPFMIGILLFSIGTDATSAINSVITKSKQFISAISPFPMTLSAISTVMYNIILLINTTVSISYIKNLIQSIKNLK